MEVRQKWPGVLTPIASGTLGYDGDWEVSGEIRVTNSVVGPVLLAELRLAAEAACPWPLRIDIVPHASRKAVRIFASAPDRAIERGDVWVARARSFLFHRLTSLALRGRPDVPVFWEQSV